jgi:hypothetical protein
MEYGLSNLVRHFLLLKEREKNLSSKNKLPVKIIRDKRDERTHEPRIKVRVPWDKSPCNLPDQYLATSILRVDILLGTEYGSNRFLWKLVPIYHITRRHILEDCNFNIQGCENLTFHVAAGYRAPIIKNWPI